MRPTVFPRKKYYSRLKTGFPSTILLSAVACIKQSNHTLSCINYRLSTRCFVLPGNNKIPKTWDSIAPRNNRVPDAGCSCVPGKNIVPDAGYVVVPVSNKVSTTWRSIVPGNNRIFYAWYSCVPGNNRVFCACFFWFSCRFEIQMRFRRDPALFFKPFHIWCRIPWPRGATRRYITR